MKKFIFGSLILLVVVCPLALKAQWVKTYGGTEDVQIDAITETADGGFIAVGIFENSYLTYTWFDAFIVKLSPEGIIEWSRTFGGDEYAGAYSVFSLEDGGAIVVGGYDEAASDLRYSMILRLDSEGNLVWQRVYRLGGYYNNPVLSVAQTTDAGFILLGVGYGEFWDRHSDITVTKLNAQGRIRWNKVYRGINDGYARAIEQTEDGGYIVAASSKSISSEDRDCWLLRLDSAGEITWQRRYSGGADEEACDVQQTSDDGFILSGWTSAYGAGETDCWILKINADGAVDWQKAFGGSRLDAINSVQETDDGGYIVAGVTMSFGAGNNDGHITKLTALGEIAWQRTYGGANQDVLNDIQQTSDGGYIAAGYTTSFGEGKREAFVLSLDSNGNIGYSCPLIASSTPSETSTTAVPGVINLVAEDFNQHKQNFDLYSGSPSLVVTTLCQAELYTLSIETTIGGTTDPAPGDYIHVEASEVEIQAIPQDQTWRFDRWSGDISDGMEMMNPISISMDRDKEITAHFKRNVLPPLQFAGSKVVNRSLSQREHINVLSWAANPENENIVKYRIYLIDGASQFLLIEVNAQTFFYWHRNVEMTRTYTYAITAVIDSGTESEPATITVQ